MNEYASGLDFSHGSKEWKGFDCLQEGGLTGIG